MIINFKIFVALILILTQCIHNSSSNEVDDPDADIIDFEPVFRPIIGIISQQIKGTNTSEIQQSYVNFIETGGGRVAPIPLDMSDEELLFVARSINGVLFPGGGTPLKQDSRYYSMHKFFMDYSIDQSKKGNHFPVWGTCLGFQAIVQYFSNNFTLIPESKFQNFNVLLTLEWNDDQEMLHTSHLLNLCKAPFMHMRDAPFNQINKTIISEESSVSSEADSNPDFKHKANPHMEFKKLLKRDLSLRTENNKLAKESSSNEHNFNHFSFWDQFMCSHRLFKATQWLPLAAYNHQNGVTIADWDANPTLSEKLEPLAYSTTKDGVKFVTVLEAKEYPIYAVQFHPEKNLFAFSPSINAPHGFYSAEITQYFANFFINEANKNLQRFPDPLTEFNYLIFKHHIHNSLLSDKIYDFLPMFIFSLDPDMLYKPVSIDTMYATINNQTAISTETSTNTTV